MSEAALQCPHCGQPIADYAPPEQLIQCPNCGGNFTANPIAQPESGAQRVEYATPLRFGGRLLPNGAAKVSLIWSILALLIPLMGFIIGESGATVGAAIFIAILILLAPILAIIFGIIGITRTRDGRHTGKGMSITGISLGGVGLLLAVLALGYSFFSPRLITSRGMSNRAKCAANLRQIGLAMQLYANENKGLYPPRPEDLILTQDITTDIFICPSTYDTQATGATIQQQAANLSTGGHDSYIYLGAGKNSNTPANVVLAYEPLKDHSNEMNVLFADGHVDFVSGPMAQKVEAELKAGQNPPPSYHP